MATFIHGTETIEVNNGLRSIREVKTAIIGLIGIAPSGPSNALTLVTNERDAAAFGKSIEGFTIPFSLQHIIAQKAGTIIVINVFDQLLHTEQITDELHAVEAGKVKLAYPQLSTVVITNEDDTPVTYTANVDYKIDEFGNLSVINGRIPDTKVLKFSYKKFKSGSVTDAHLMGTVSTSGARTGIKLLDQCLSKFGFVPKILISPHFSTSKVVAEELLIAANKYRAVVALDCADNITVSQAIQSRSSAGDSSFNTSDSRAILLYPHITAYNEATNDSRYKFPLSAIYAGVMARTDNEHGYWHSPSNKTINGITGLANEISASSNDQNSDTNILNSSGITTVFNSAGFLVWGNRNASYPVSNLPTTFISLRRIADVVHDSLEAAAMPFIDSPLNPALVDDIRQTGNNFLKVLVGRGALLEGSKVVFKSEDNPVTDLAEGKVKFRIIFMGAVPAETITFFSQLDITLYSTLK